MAPPSAAAAAKRPEQSAAPLSIEEPRFAIARGPHVGAVRAQDGFSPHEELTLSSLRSLLLTHQHRPTKDGEYICRPMRGDGQRSDVNAAPWRLVPVDVDELHASEFPVLVRWCEESGIAGFLATTFSHRADQPKVRIWFVASREISAEEHAFVHLALTRRVPFKMDPCMAKPSQPCFLPSCPPERAAEAVAREIAGAPLDVDLLLDSYRQEIEEVQRARAERSKGGAGSGVRQPGGLIDYFNQHYDLADLIERHGYQRKTRNRYIAPASNSRRAAVVLYEKSLVSFHDPAHDPLAVRNAQLQAMVLDVFSAYCKLEHADDFKAAFAGALKWARAKGWSEGRASGVTSGGSQQSVSAASLPPLHLMNPLELYASLRPQAMVVERMLDQGSVVIAAGDSNSGKTTILQYLAFQIAQGAPFAAHRTKRGRALWIAGEDMENAKYRTVAMCEEYGVDPASLADSFLLLPQPVAVLDPASMTSLQEAISAKVGAGAEFVLVVLDSKSVNWGGADENSNDENASFVAAVRRYLIDPFGAPAVIITHHLTKHKEKEAQSSRGASSLINNADHEWRFDMNQDARIAAARPGSKVRVERWADQRFLVKVVELDKAKFPQLTNNFGTAPRISIAEPVNQYNKSMRQLQQDSDLRAALAALNRLLAAGSPAGLSHVASDLNWTDSSSKPDYRKAKRVLELAEKQQLVTSDGKSAFTLTDAGQRYLAEDDALSSSPSREPGEDDQ